MGFNSRKFAQYIKYDRLDRVKEYLKSYGSSLMKLPLDRKMRTAIHLACKHRSSYSLLHFFNCQASIEVADKDGNLPLHLLLIGKSLSRKDCKDILQPLLLKCSPELLSIPNNKGETVVHLLGFSTYMNFLNGDDIGETTNAPYSQNVSDDDSDEAAWNEKLRSMANEDYEQDMGKFERDESAERVKGETYDDWTNRIADEYSSKRQRNSSSFRRKRPKQNQNEEPSKNEELRHQERNRRLIEMQTNRRPIQKMKFAAETRRIFSKEDASIIHRKNLPWISYTQSEEMLLNILLSGIDQSDSAQTKKCLREHQLQWHPDKFNQMCSHRLDESDKTEVLAEVNHFSQIINAALQKIS